MHEHNQSNKITVDIAQATKLVKTILKAGLVPHLKGPPGLGKTALAAMVARDFNLFLIDERLCYNEPTDQKGLPSVDKEAGKASYLPFDTFPLEGDEIPINPETGKPYNGFLLMLDELDSSPPSVVASAYKLILDRMIGQKKLHPRCLVMTAGNSVDDGAIAYDLGTAMNSRLIHLYIHVNPDKQIKYAAENNWDHRVVSFMAFRPDLIHNFNPDSEDDTFSCPRTLEFLSKLVKKVDKVDLSTLPLFAGTVGQGVAHDFVSFCEYYEDLPTKEEIVKNPEGVKLSEDSPGIAWAASGLVAHNINEKNAKPFLTFLRRLHPDMQIVAMRQATTRCPELTYNEHFIDWASENAEEFLD